MRSIGLLAAVTGTLVLASACGGGGGSISPPDNTAPVANFVVPTCTMNAVCSFVSTSTDDAQVTAWSWDFNGDGIADANTANAVFTYGTAADFQVSLTVHDAQGLSDTKTSTITIAPPNAPPTAGFTHTCTGVDCTFASTSTDVAPGTIVTYAWDLGDGATADVSNPSHSYTATGPTDFTVTLTVTDNGGATAVETQTVSVIPVNTPPTAAFTHTCNAAVCTFTNTSTDVAPGTIATYAWTFGDGGTADVINPLHSYAITAPTSFTVTLTVTDNEGATAVETQTVAVSPPPVGAEGCTTKGTLVECDFNITARSTVLLTLNGLNCDLAGDRITIPPPISDQTFLNVCVNRKAGDALKIYGGPLDEAIVYEAGSQLRIWFNQGRASGSHPVLGSPAATFTGTFPQWTVSIEDGDHPGDAGEPDFTDIVLQIDALPQR